MGPFRRASHERVNAFPVGGVYLVRHYFEGDRVFARLRRYYDAGQYRFEVPDAAFEDVRAFLAEHGYALAPVETTEPFVVVVRKYTAHPDSVFEDAVDKRSVAGNNCFLLASRDAVGRAIEGGATPIAATELENPF